MLLTSLVEHLNAYVSPVKRTSYLTDSAIRNNNNTSKLLLLNKDKLYSVKTLH